MNSLLINKNKIIYNFLVLILYLSLFQYIIDGFLLHINEQLYVVVKSFIQIVIYALPTAAILLINKYTIRSISIILFLLYVFLSQLLLLSEFITFLTIFSQIKVIILPLLYIPIIEFLVKNNQKFLEKFSKHIQNIFLITSLIVYFELSARYIENPLYHLFLSLAHDSSIAMPFGRPIGIQLNIHSSGYILAVGILYYVVQQKYKWVIFLFIPFFMTGNKTWFVALLVALLIYGALNLHRIKIKILLKGVFAGLMIFTLIYFFFSAQIEHLISEFTLTSNSIQIFTHLWSKLFDFIQMSYLPNGFVSDHYRTNILDFKIASFTDAVLIWYIYQMGIFGALMYVVIVYYPIFRQNQYNVIVALSLFAMFHTNQLQFVNNMILLAFFEAYRFQNQLSKGSSYQTK